MAAKVIPIGSPVNDAERQAIAHLRNTLPSTCIIIHNFEIKQGKEIFEIDLAVLTVISSFQYTCGGKRQKM